MATRKYVTDDGSVFDDKASAHAHESRRPHLDALIQNIGLEPQHAEAVLAHFEHNFRVPTKRARKPKHDGGTGGTGGTGGGNDSAGASTAPVKAKVK